MIGKATVCRSLNDADMVTSFHSAGLTVAAIAFDVDVTMGRLFLGLINLGVSVCTRGCTARSGDVDRVSNGVMADLAIFGVFELQSSLFGATSKESVETCTERAFV
jgi:hypothetical protein